MIVLSDKPWQCKSLEKPKGEQKIAQRQAKGGGGWITVKYAVVNTRDIDKKANQAAWL